MVHVTSAFLFVSLLLNAASSSFALPLSVRHSAAADSVVARALPVGAIEPVFAREIDFAPNLAARQAVPPLEPSAMPSKRDASPQRQHARDIYYIGPNAGKQCRQRPTGQSGSGLTGQTGLSGQTGQTGQTGLTGQTLPSVGSPAAGSSPSTGATYTGTGVTQPLSGQTTPGGSGQPVDPSLSSSYTGGQLGGTTSLTGYTGGQQTGGQQGGTTSLTGYTGGQQTGGQQGGGPTSLTSYTGGQQTGGQQGGTTSLTGYTGVTDPSTSPSGGTNGFPGASLTGVPQQSNGQVNQAQTPPSSVMPSTSGTTINGSAQPNGLTSTTGHPKTKKTT